MSIHAAANREQAELLLSPRLLLGRDGWRDAAQFQARSVLALLAERDRLREALEAARHWHEQLDYDEALNVIDAALAKEEPWEAS